MRQEESRGGKRWIILGILSLSLFIIAVDNAVLGLALPAISNDLGASASELQWIVDAYILVFASLLFTTGTFGDRYGRKLLLQAGMLMFGIVSLGAALSTSTEMLIGCRALMGIGAAMIMPSTLSILTDTFRDPKERPKAIAMWSAVYAFGAAIGPVIGGYLIEYFDWRWVFYVNIPVAMVALISGYLMIGESKGAWAPKPDVLGVTLSISGLFALVYGIIKAGETSWSNGTVLLCLGLASVILGVFVWFEKQSKTPMLPLGFFRNLSFTGGSLAILVTFFSIMGSMFFASQYLQTVQGFSPVAAAIRMLPAGFAIFIFAMLSAQVAQRIGNKITISLGLLISGIGMLYFALVIDPNTPYPDFFFALVLVAGGGGLMIGPATDAIQGSLPVSRAGVGSAMNDTTRQVGGALGIAVLGALLNATYLDEIDKLPVLASLPTEATEAIRSSIQGAHIAADQLPAETSQAVVDSANSAFCFGVVDGMIGGAIAMGVFSLLIFIIQPKRVKVFAEHAEASPDTNDGHVSPNDARLTQEMDKDGGKSNNCG